MKKDIMLIMDTTRDELFLALVVDEKETRMLVPDCNSKHSVIMLDKIDELLKSNNVDICEVSTFALSIGPGSFTGIRIGATTVKGFIFANKNAKVITVNSLEANAYNHLKETSKVFSIIDAKHDNAYIGEFDFENFKMIEKSLWFTNAKEIEKLCNEGEFVSSPYQNSFNVKVTENYYDGFMALIKKKYCEKDFSDENFAPLYLKKSQAEEEADGNC